MADPLRGQICLITGASRGLGAKLAEVFWGAGAHLALTSRSLSSLASLRDSLPVRPGQQLLAIEADPADPSATEAVLQQARAAFSRLDVLINNAAVQGPIGPAWENDWNEWKQAVDIDFLFPARLCSAVIPWMKDGGGGSIINLSGGGAVGPRPNFSAYASAKSALVRFSETLAQEACPFGIRVNCVAPGAMATQMTEAVIRAGAAAAGDKEYEQALKIRAENGPVMERAAALCLFLAGSGAQGISGRLISAVWDPWTALASHADELAASDVYTLRRILPPDRGFHWEGLE